MIPAPWGLRSQKARVSQHASRIVRKQSMSSDISADEKRSASDRGIEPRTRRAVTEIMTVLDDAPPVRGEPDAYHVTTGSGKSYIVDARDWTCSCADFQRRKPERGCKHIRRVKMVRGEFAIPYEFDEEDLDDDFGKFVDSHLIWGVPPAETPEEIIRPERLDERPPEKLVRAGPDEEVVVDE